ncbi:MAG TPA: family 43 glycosylhydrolase [Candidatus Krumholzibacteria bacterium]|nr:family 43 glycosylhydrolase [Candidatus Krumholzibacteria bacterium]
MRTPWTLATGAWLLAMVACDGGTAASKQSCNDVGASPTFLQSKIDDDDGDGFPYEQDFPRLDVEDDDISDHTWFRDDNGVFHLFFQNEDIFGPSHIEHYISNDLQSLTYVGVALLPQPGAWDGAGTWAPHVIRNGGRYYMFYTGVDVVGSERHERIGLATSDDLYAWSRIPGGNCPGAVGDGCVYECRECWTTVGTAGSFNDQCRDPFVIRDGDHWLLFATARSLNQYATVTVAHSANLVDWTGDGLIDATRRLSGLADARATGGMAENPFVIQHDGLNYLFFTDWRDPEDSLSVVTSPRTIAQYATSPSLAADTLGSANWTYRGYIPDPGMNAIEIQRVPCGFGDDRWLMSFSVANPHSGYTADHRRHLRLVFIEWHGDGTFATINPALIVPGPRSRGPLP